VVYYESGPEIDEDAFLEHVHRFFCEKPEDPNAVDCPLHAMTLQDVVLD